MGGGILSSWVVRHCRDRGKISEGISFDLYFFTNCSNRLPRRITADLTNDWPELEIRVSGPSAPQTQITSTTELTRHRTSENLFSKVTITLTENERPKHWRITLFLHDSVAHLAVISDFVKPDGCRTGTDQLHSVKIHGFLWIKRFWETRWVVTLLSSDGDNKNLSASSKFYTGFHWIRTKNVAMK